MESGSGAAEVTLTRVALERGLRVRLAELESCGLSAREALEVALLVEADVQRAARLLCVGGRV